MFIYRCSHWKILILFNLNVSSLNCSRETAPRVVLWPWTLPAVFLVFIPVLTLESVAGVCAVSPGEGQPWACLPLWQPGVSFPVSWYSAPLGVKQHSEDTLWDFRAVQQWCWPQKQIVGRVSKADCRAASLFLSETSTTSLWKSWNRFRRRAACRTAPVRWAVSSPGGPVANPVCRNPRRAPSRPERWRRSAPSGSEAPTPLWRRYRSFCVKIAALKRFRCPVLAARALRKAVQDARRAGGEDVCRCARSRHRSWQRTQMTFPPETFC